MSGLSVNVGSLIKKTPITVRLGTSIRDAIKIMYSNNVGSVVIVDEDFRPVGIFTERDTLRVIAKDIPLDSPIEEVMSRNLIVLNAKESIYKAISVMSTHNIRHTPIIGDDGKLIGVISIRDIIDKIKSMIAEEAASSEMRVFTG